MEELVRETLGHREPSALCLRYLAFVSRCYVYGFDAECVAMCRSAMEEAFQECVTPYDCYSAGRREPLTLADRIYAAQAKPQLAGQAKLFMDAEAVRERGKKAVHGDPDAVNDVLGTVERALRVIDALSTLQA